MTELKGRGSAARAIGEGNKTRVYRYITENPFHQQKDCAEALGLSTPCVSQCVKAIRNGWRPPQDDDHQEAVRYSKAG